MAGIRLVARNLTFHRGVDPLPVGRGTVDEALPRLVAPDSAADMRLALMVRTRASYGS